MPPQEADFGTIALYDLETMSIADRDALPFGVVGFEADTAPRDHPGPGDIVGVSSGGPLDEDVGVRLLASGLSRLVDIYGSSETGGIAMRDVPATAFSLLPRWRLSPLGEGDWQLVDGRGGYAGLPDQVECIGDRALRPIRRRDGAVQVGGHNVWPERVVRLLREVDGVSDAAVRLDANGRLKAFVVRHGSQDHDGLAIRIEQVAAPQLTDLERLASYRFGATLPRNAMGKLEDRA